MSVTTASAALHDLVETMKAIDRLYDRSRIRRLSLQEDERLSQLERRRDGLEDQLKREVREKLGIDYVVLWHAITPSEPAPTRQGRWII